MGKGEERDRRDLPQSQAGPVGRGKIGVGKVEERDGGTCHNDKPGL